MAHENGSTTKAALDLARRGWLVFPVKSKGKTPATPNGFYAGSSDPIVVEKLFSRRRDYNLGVATGPGSEIWVLDVEAEGIRDLDQLQQQHGTLPTTVSSITGGGGRHLFFAYDGTEIRNRTRIGGLSIDVRGAGGYVVLPPSIHSSGKRYEWERSPASTPIAEAPPWLIDLVVGSGDSKPTSTSGGSSFQIGGGDLATAPGAAQGQRHDTALRLIGSAIGRGVDLCTVARQAIEWSRRCLPAMEEQEVLKIVGDLSQRQWSRSEAIRQAVEETPLPEPVEWPVLHPDAYYGLAGQVVKAISPESEADPVAILVQLLISFGNLIGRGPHFVVEGTEHHCNLFAVLVGATARGRKGTSEGRVRQIVRFVDEDWTLDNIKTGLVSGEGVVWAVRDPVYKTENVKEHGRIVGTEGVLADPGVVDKRLLVIESEFAAVLRVCRRETNTLSPTMRSAWDSGILRTMAKNSPAKATDAHISIIGHITHEELRRALPEIDGFNGFANRFLWIAVRRSKLLPDGGRDLDLAPYAERLASAVEQARSVDRMHRDQGAAALWRRAYADLAGDRSTGLLAAVTSRAEAQVLRLSMIYGLLDGSSTITVEHLKAALAVWQYAEASAQMIFGGSTGDTLADRLSALIHEAPGISRGEMHRRVSSNIKAADLISALARLRDTGSVRVEKTETGGKPAEHWFPASTCGFSANSAISPEPPPQSKPLSALNAQNDQPLSENTEGDDGMEEIRI